MSLARLLKTGEVYGVDSVDTHEISLAPIASNESLVAQGAHATAIADAGVRLPIQRCTEGSIAKHLAAGRLGVDHQTHQGQYEYEP
ncbi:MAG: hypothetical protein GY768_28825 [Planctomycetaceae bacterium]|nr:hypothetical protein [Planctomycetaceae bacterium]